eukprot:155951-Pelagomonas_calceolata.AAC.3
MLALQGSAVLPHCSCLEGSGWVEGGQLFVTCRDGLSVPLGAGAGGGRGSDGAEGWRPASALAQAEPPPAAGGEWVPPGPVKLPGGREAAGGPVEYGGLCGMGACGA